MRLLLIFVIAISFVSCKRNQLKKPTTVSIKMNINRNASNDGRLQFNEGFIIIEEFVVEGTRREGDPISFEKSFPNGLEINFLDQDVSELDYELPQGAYTELVFTFATKYVGGNSNIEVQGVYTNDQNQDIPIVFSFTDEDEIRIIGDDSRGGSNIILDKSKHSSAEIQFDPIYWFELVSNNMLDNATLYNQNGVQTIIVSSSKNEDIYDLVVDRMEETAMALWSND